jgi:hypothetical protein
MKKNIVIGSNIILDDGVDNRLVLKSDTVDFDGVITDREYNLISMVIRCINENQIELH